MVTPPSGSEELSLAVRAVLAGIDEAGTGEDAADRRQARDLSGILARRHFYVAAPDRGGTSSFVRKGGVILHEPTVALLLPSDFPPLARRRPDFAGLRHVLVRFSFMLDHLPPRHAYESATLVVTLEAPSAVVRAQRPAWVTADVESVDSVTTEFSAALDGLVRLGGNRTQVTGTKYRAGRLPVVTAENRGRAGFGWKYQAQEGAPLLPRVEFTLAVVEMPRAVRELSGHLSAEAVIAAPRFGVLTSTRAAPAEPPVPFSLQLGEAGSVAG
jgi:hypothetical protein